MKNAHGLAVNICFYIIFGLFFSDTAFSKLNILTTTQNIHSLVSEVGGDEVTVTSITKGHQDPHFIEAKPSFIFKAARSDLLVSVGLDLEVGWLPSILSGARNRKIMPGNPGSLILGEHVKPLHVPHGNINRKMGDVHPAGNPHFMLDPKIVGRLALIVADKLSELDKSNGKLYKDRAMTFQGKMSHKNMVWKFRIRKSQNLELVSYHRTLAYFFEGMGIKLLDAIEPKPGVPPTANHILSLSKKIKTKKIKTILVEHYFDSSAAQKIKQHVPEVAVSEVAVQVNGNAKATNLESLFEALVKVIEGDK